MRRSRQPRMLRVACSAAWNCAEEIFEIVPTTLAGMRAKIDFAFSVGHVTDELMSSDEMVQNFIETLYEAAHMMAVRS
jgi:hypothetical protein